MAYLPMTVMVCFLCVHLVVTETAMKNCHSNEISQTVLVEPGNGVTLHCWHNVSSPALLSMLIAVPCGDQLAEVYGPVLYRDQVLHGQFNITSNISTHIKEKMACCQLTLYDYEGRPNGHHLYNCTLILPVNVEESADSKDGLQKQLVIGVVISILITILLILILIFVLGCTLPWSQRRSTTSGKRDNFDDSDKLALSHSEAMQCSEAVQQSDKNHSYSDSVFVAPTYYGNAKKELVCVENSDTPFMDFDIIQSIQKMCGSNLKFYISHGVKDLGIAVLVNNGVKAVDITAKHVQECQVMSDLRHSNVMYFLSSYQLPMLVMDILHVSVDNLLENDPNIPVTLKYSILMDVAKGLLYLQNCNPQIIHRDLTVKNVLLTSSLLAKITNFGNYHIVNTHPGQPTQMLSQNLEFVPPETQSDEAPYGFSDDTFSFGVVIINVPPVVQSNDGDGVNDVEVDAMPTLSSSLDAVKPAASHEIPVVMMEDLQGAEWAMEPPIDLPSPVTNLTIPKDEEEEELEITEKTENLTKEIVSGNSTCSVDRYIDESGQSAAVDKKTVTEPETLPTSEDMAFYMFDELLEASKARNARMRALLDSLLEDLEETFPEECIQLDGIGELGLSYSDGENHNSHVFGQGRPGIYISMIKISNGGPAISNLRLGDRVLEINNHNVRCANLQQAEKLFSANLGNDKLLVQHVPQPSGLQIGGAADKDGQLKEGDRILTISEILLQSYRTSCLDAHEALWRSPDRTEITICHGYDPKEVLRKKSEAEAATYGNTDRISNFYSGCSSINCSVGNHFYCDSTIKKPDPVLHCYGQTIYWPLMPFMDNKLSHGGRNAYDSGFGKTIDLTSIPGDPLGNAEDIQAITPFWGESANITWITGESFSDGYQHIDAKTRRQAEKWDLYSQSYPQAYRDFTFTIPNDIQAITPFWGESANITWITGESFSDGYRHIDAKTRRQAEKWDLYSQSYPQAYRDFTFTIPNANIREPYKERYEHIHGLSEPVISAVLVLLAVVCIPLQNDFLYTQNLNETN